MQAQVLTATPTPTFEAPRPATPVTMNRKLLWMLTITTVFGVGNVYYSQPLLGEIASTFHRSPTEVGIIPTLNQLGYMTGLFFLTPLGDVLEKRKLLTTLLFISSLSLLALGLAPNFATFAVVSFAIGVTALLGQIMIPFVAVLSHPSERGRNLGVILSGGLMGVLLSRTLSGFIGEHFGWRTVFYVGSALMLVLSGLLRFSLPRHEPTAKIPYLELIQSLWHLLRDLPKLRAIAINGALMYAALSAFWASLAFYLESPTYHLGPQAAGLFGLVGAVGALSANITGRHAERIGPRRVVLMSIGVMILSLLAMAVFGHTMIGLISGVVLLDMGAQAASVSNQTQVYSLHPQAQVRLNTIYKIFYFGGGALGAGLSTIGWQHFGWYGVCAVGISFLILALIWEKISQ